MPRTLFTVANAAEMARRSHAPGSARFRLPEPEKPQPQLIPQSAMDADDFASRRLMRVREQLQRLDDLAALAVEPKALKELADATTRLAEQERILAGRPLPGSRRPSAEPKQPRSWIGVQPQALIEVKAQVEPAPKPLDTGRLPGDVTP